MKWAEVSARRLERQSLSAPAKGKGPADVVAAICGAHAQVLSAAELSVGLRLDGVTRTDVRDALWNERSLVKTFGPRGTVHLLAARDLPLWTGALSAIPDLGSPFKPDVRMTPGQTDEVIEAIADALADDELTVDELTEAIVERTGSWAGDLVMPAFQTMWPRWRQITHTAAHRGALCFGPNKGRKISYTNPHRWLPGFKPQGEEAALAGLVEGYLYGYGPATSQHFARWLSAPRKWAADLFESLGDRLEEVDIDGDLAWVPAGDTAVPSRPPQGVRLLPYFDAFTVGSHPRELLFPGRAAERALAGGQAGNFPVLLIDGVVAGVWHQRRSGRKINVTVEPLGKLTKAHRAALDEQVVRTGEILEGAPELTIGTVTVGGHA